jgi:hypothetical protein
MFRTSILLAGTILASIGSTSLAGFQISTQVTTGVAPGLDRWDFFALNTGGGTGTRINAMEFALDVHGGKSYWKVDDLGDGGDLLPDGIPDTVNIGNFSNTPLKSFVRLANAPSLDLLIGVVPNLGFQQPNPWSGGVSEITLLIVSSARPVANTGLGHRFASLVVDAGATVTGLGLVGGDAIGSASSIWSVPSTTAPLAPNITLAPVPLVIDLGRGQTAGESLVRVVDPDTGRSNYNIVFGNITGGPGNIADNFLFIPAPGPGRIILQNLNAADVGTYTIPMSVTDSTGLSDQKTLEVRIIIPEPMSGLLPVMLSTLAKQNNARRAGAAEPE